MTDGNVSGEPVEDYLRGLVRRCPDAPLIRELTAADVGTERGTAAIARAALAWLREGRDDELAVRLTHELDEADWYVAWRLRRASGDVADAVDWVQASQRPSWAELERRRQEVA